MAYIIGVDIGGSHITAALLAAETGFIIKQNKKNIDTGADRNTIISTWIDCIHSVIKKAEKKNITGVSIAMPGPFDYENGICRVTGLSKYESVFGLNIKAALKQKLAIDTKCTVVFINDAKAFAMGVSEETDTLLAVTFGTGLGAAFIQNGKICNGGANGIPENGELYNIPYEDSTIENYLSARYIIKRFEELSGEKLPDVASVTLHKNVQSIEQVFNEFGKRAGSFLKKYMHYLNSNLLVIGGGISKSYYRFEESLKKELGTDVIVRVSADTETDIIKGTFRYFKMMNKTTGRKLRKTSQQLLLLEKAERINGYDIYPAYVIEPNRISNNWNVIAEIAIKNKQIIIDGFSGVLWDIFIKNLSQALQAKGVEASYISVESAFKNEADIFSITDSYTGGYDPLFGKLCPLNLIDFFDAEKLEKLIPSEEGITVIYGTGASLCGWKAPLIYIDVPKNEIQYRSRAGSITNTGISNAFNAKLMYKRFYYIDWPVLNRHKKELLIRIDYFIDGQHTDNLVLMSGDDLRRTMQKITHDVFRVRPWFEAGVWGGQWMKEKIQHINKTEINYAWSFELIAPENGVVLQSDKKLLEFSFDFLMFYDNDAINGKEGAARFGDEFPIRFDFLDTYDGGNLSVQCHPSTEYIKKDFGENFTQDETYYILDCKPDAKVYLGFQDDINPEEFRQQLENSFQTNDAIDIPKYVQVHDAQKHDLFLIPNGTIHCSGINNLVLEISATPYIYTFKMYDWIRPDLDGNPRPLNIKRAFENLDFSRKGNYVTEKLISKPYLYSSGDGWQCFHLPTHQEHFYDIIRYEIDTEVEIETFDSCHVLSLVEGKSVGVAAANNNENRFYYAETFIVPAAAKKYRLINNTVQKIKVVVAFLKPLQQNKIDKY